MAKGVSIHIGLNVVDQNSYNVQVPLLWGCINDAQAMQQIAIAQGYSSTMLLDGDATSDNVIEAIGRAAQGLVSGDILLLTYSGHGAQIPDLTGDEDDGMDETWVLYDRMMIDDELYGMWSQFEPGVRIFMLSDSCHSGTMSKEFAYNTLARQPVLARDYNAGGELEPIFRTLTPAQQYGAYQQHIRLYKALQWANSRGDDVAIGATVLLISGCQDNQLSSDGAGNGLFTGALLQVWSDGNFEGDYQAFATQIGNLMPPTQSPRYSTIGGSNATFENQLPFTINAGAEPQEPQPTSSKPSIRGPESSAYSDAAPTFVVDPSPNRYYVVEVTTDPYLFDITNYGPDRRDDNFYGSWSREQNGHLLAAHYTLPDDVWDLLRQQADFLYYRVGSTSSPRGWDNYSTSVADYEGSQAQYIEINRARVLVGANGRGHR